jgi:hypothetical protein
MATINHNLETSGIDVPITNGASRSPVVSPSPTAWLVRLESDKHWLRLVVSLAGMHRNGLKFVQWPENSIYEITSDDRLSSPYTKENWLAGVRSGLIFGFRSHQRPLQLQCVLIHELTAKLDSDGADALAFASALAISKLLGSEMVEQVPAGWTVKESASIILKELVPAD